MVIVGLSIGLSAASVAMVVITITILLIFCVHTQMKRKANLVIAEPVIGVPFTSTGTNLPLAPEDDSDTKQHMVIDNDVYGIV